jgi:hypothetical protein
LWGAVSRVNGGKGGLASSSAFIANSSFNNGKLNEFNSFKIRKGSLFGLPQAGYADIDGQRLNPAEPGNYRRIKGNRKD